MAIEECISSINSSTTVLIRVRTILLEILSQEMNACNMQHGGDDVEVDAIAIGSGIIGIGTAGGSNGRGSIGIGSSIIGSSDAVSSRGAISISGGVALVSCIRFWVSEAWISTI